MLREMKQQGYIYSIYILIIFIVIACREEKNESYFNGEVKIVNFSKAKDLKGTFIELDDVFVGTMLVYDSLLLGGSGENSHVFNVFGLNSRKKLGILAMRGQGPDDFIDATSAGKQFVKEGDDICFWLGDSHGKYLLINISASLKEGRTIILKRYDNMSGRKKWLYGFGAGYILDDDLLLVRTQSESLYQSDKCYQPASYHLYKNDIDHHVKDYTLFNKPIYSPDENFNSELFCNTTDGMRPDKKKMAMGMPFVGQLNIMDIKSGKQTGYLLKDSYDFDYFASHSVEDYKAFFESLCVDQQYIYAACINKKITAREDDGSYIRAKKILVFDWEGNPTITLNLDHHIMNMSFDPVHRMMYVLDNEDELYRYDMNFLYE